MHTSGTSGLAELTPTLDQLCHYLHPLADQTCLRRLSCQAHSLNFKYAEPVEGRTLDERATSCTLMRSGVLVTTHVWAHLGLST